MTTEKLIAFFKDYCSSPGNRDRRRDAVAAQHNRNAWELYGPQGIVRIDRRHPRYTITLFPTIGSGNSGEMVRSMTEEQFDELEKLFWGDYSYDPIYLKKLGVTGI